MSIGCEDMSKTIFMNQQWEITLGWIWSQLDVGIEWDYSSGGLLLFVKVLWIEIGIWHYSKSYSEGNP